MNNLAWPWNRIEKKFEILQEKLNANRKTFSIEEVQDLVKKILQEGKKPTIKESLKNFCYEIVRMACVGFNWYQQIIMKGLKALWQWLTGKSKNKKATIAPRRPRPNMMTRL